MSRGNVQDIFPLSPLQEGILYHALFQPASGVYLTQLGWTLFGDLDTAALRQAFQAVMDRHATLRTGFVWESRPKPLQVVLRQVELPWVEEDWTALSQAEQKERQEKLLAGDRERGFDLSRPPLTRLCLLRLKDRTYRLIWTFHHLILDGWSTTIVLREAFGLFAASRRGMPSELPAERPYRDYITWLRDQGRPDAEPFWREMLAGVEEPTHLGIDHPGSTSAAPDHHVKWQWPLPDSLGEALRAFSRREHLTPSTLLHGAWALLLGQRSGRDDVVFGTLVSGRPADLEGSDSMVGLFINTLPLRVRLRTTAALPEWLRELHLVLAKVREHGHCPLVEVQGFSSVPRRLPLFESVVIFDNVGLASAFGVADATVAGIAIENAFGIDQNSLPLTLTVRPELLDFEYDPRRFSEASVARLGEELGALLELLVARPRSTLGEIRGRLTEIATERRVASGESRARFSFDKFKKLRSHA